MCCVLFACVCVVCAGVCLCVLTVVGFVGCLCVCFVCCLLRNQIWVGSLCLSCVCVYTHVFL